MLQSLKKLIALRFEDEQVQHFKFQKQIKKYAVKKLFLFPILLQLDIFNGIRDTDTRWIESFFF